MRIYMDIDDDEVGHEIFGWMFFVLLSMILRHFSTCVYHSCGGHANNLLYIVPVLLDVHGETPLALLHIRYN